MGCRAFDGIYQTLSDISTLICGEGGAPGKVGVDREVGAPRRR